MPIVTPYAVWALAPFSPTDNIVPGYDPDYDPTFGGAVPVSWVYFKTPDGTEFFRLASGVIVPGAQCCIGADGSLYSAADDSPNIRLSRHTLHTYGSELEAPATVALVGFSPVSLICAPVNNRVYMIGQTSTSLIVTDGATTTAFSYTGDPTVVAEPGYIADGLDERNNLSGVTIFADGRVAIDGRRLSV